eukprot:2051-Rhodomonas_salina.1
MSPSEPAPGSIKVKHEKSPGVNPPYGYAESVPGKLCQSQTWHVKSVRQQSNATVRSILAGTKRLGGTAKAVAQA